MEALIGELWQRGEETISPNLGTCRLVGLQPPSAPASLIHKPAIDQTVVPCLRSAPGI